MYSLAVVGLWRVLSGSAALASGPADDWIVDRWDMRDGMPQNSVTDLLQSQDGYIWLTTFGGIARFDGREFVVYHRGNTPGLATRFSSIAETPDGSLWFGSEEQGLFRLRDGVMTSVGPPVKIWDLATDEQGQLWAAGPTQLFRLAADDLEEVPGFPGLRSLSALGDGVVIGSSANGRAWCITGDCEAVRSLAVEGAGTALWFRAPSGALRAAVGAAIYEPSAEGWAQILRGPDHTVFPLLCTISDGEQLCAQDEHPFRLDAPHWASFGDAPARALLVDRSGGLWVGTDGIGLLYYQRREVTLHHNQGVFDVVEAPDGTIWFTTSRRSYHIGLTPPPWGEQPAVTWSGTEGGEVLAIREDRLWRVSAAGVREHTGAWTDIVPPVEGPCFVTDARTLHLLPEDGPPRPALQAAELGATELVPLRCSASGEAWLAADKARLIHLVGGEVVEDIPVGSGVLLRDVHARGGWLWAASYGQGLLGIRDGAVRVTLTPREGMCDYAVSRIIDLGDALWLNTNRGVGRVSWDALRAAAEDGAPLRCHLFDSGEGNGSSGVRSRDGVLWLPTINGVAEVHPTHLRDAVAPLLYIDAARYGQAPVTPGAVLAGPGALDVHFVGLHYPDPHGVRYRYRLVGVDAQWSEPSSNNRVRYASLRPGAYRFEVQARGRGGQWSEPASLSFSRTPLWHERPLVRAGVPLLIGAAIILGLLLLLRQSVRHNRRLAAEIAERRRVQEALRRKQDEVDRARQAREAGRRLEALGRLAGGIAHDLNNLMTVLAVHISILAEHSDDEVREEAEGLSQVLQQATSLSRGLLVFGRRDAAPQVLELGAAVEGMLPMLQRLIRADIALALTRGARCGVRIDPGRLAQIVTNLVLNARDALGGAGTVRLAVRAADGQAELSVEDDGAGMSPDTVEHIFEPYFTTKVLGEGTGLGMATVHGAVQEAGGTITIHSALGEGTRVQIRLPLHPLPAPPPPPAAERTARGGLRALIVDDRPEVLKSVVALVTRIGWTVSSAGGLEEAVAAAREERFDLLLTDIVMPGGDGPAVQAAVRRLQPDLPTVFMTGYTDRPGDLGEDAVVLHKPFSLQDLLRATRQALGEG